MIKRLSFAKRQSRKLLVVILILFGGLLLFSSPSALSARQWPHGPRIVFPPFFVTGDFDGSPPQVYKYAWKGPAAADWSVDLVGNCQSGGCRAATMADYDGNGMLDFTMASSATREVYLFRNSVFGRFDRSVITTLPVSDGEISHDGCAGDFNGDGNYDFALAVGTTLHVFENDGAAHFMDHSIPITGISPPISPPIHGMDAVEVERDAFGDIVPSNAILLIDNDGRKIYVLRIDLLADSAALLFTLEAPTGVYFHGVAVGDIHGKRTLDIVAQSTDGEGWYYQNGSPIGSYRFWSTDFSSPPTVLYDTSDQWGLIDMYSFDDTLGSEDTEATGWYNGVFFIPNSVDPASEIPASPKNQTAIAAPPLMQDIDHDKKKDAEDNCPIIYNPDQADRDHDGIGDACEAPPVGGMVKLPPAAIAAESGTQNDTAWPAGAYAAVVASVALLLSAGAWYARRRWLH